MYIMIICHWAILHYNMSFKTIAGRSDGVFWWFPALSRGQEFFLLLIYQNYRVALRLCEWENSTFNTGGGGGDVHEDIMGVKQKSCAYLFMSLECLGNAFDIYTIFHHGYCLFTVLKAIVLVDLLESEILMVSDKTIHKAFRIQKLYKQNP